MQGFGITLLVVILLILALAIWVRTSQPKVTPTMQRRVDLADTLVQAAGLLMQANHAYSHAAAHELERDAAGMLRSVLHRLPAHERPTLTLARQRTLAPEVAQ